MEGAVRRCQRVYFQRCGFDQASELGGVQRTVSKMRIGNPELPVYLRMNETAKLLACASFFGGGNAMVLVGVSAVRK
jgi:hypothetical protein